MRSIANAIATLALLVGTGLALGSAASAQPGYGNVIGNDMSKCAADKGPAIKIMISGLKNSAGNLYVRTYRASSSDWLKSKRYLSRLNAQPRRGSVTVCVPVPSAGEYAVAVQHDVNGNAQTDLTIDGGGISNNVAIKRVLGIPRPPAVSQAAFSVGKGVRELAIRIQYP
jgi:uncharacterized protein (DUF2141 family)